MARSLDDKKLQEWLETQQNEKLHSFNEEETPRGIKSSEIKNYQTLYQLLGNEEVPALDPGFNENLMGKIAAWKERKAQIKSILSIFIGSCFTIPLLYYFVQPQTSENLQQSLASWIYSILSPFNQDYITGFTQGFQNLNMNISAFFLAGIALLVIFLFDEFIIRKKKGLFHSEHMISF